MHKREKLFVVVGAEASKLEAARALYLSLSQKLPWFDLNFELLVFNALTLLDTENLPFIVFDQVNETLPIVETRNRCQAHLYQRLKQFGGIGMVLDDDLIWDGDQDVFLSIVSQLRKQRCDMAFMGMKGDAPIPREYMRASPLLDLLLAARDKGWNSPESETYLKMIGLCEQRIAHRDAHHDFYAFNTQAFVRFDCELVAFDLSAFLQRIYIGQHTTRAVYSLEKVEPASGVERGGATLILNPDVLQIKNLSFSCSGLTSRRSDMLMALEAAQSGFVLRNTPPLLTHCRTETFDFNNPKKLVADIFGNALVQWAKNCYDYQSFVDVLHRRCQKTRGLITATDIMLDLVTSLPEFNVKALGLQSLINTMHLENKEALDAVFQFEHDVWLDISLLGQLKTYQPNVSPLSQNSPNFLSDQIISAFAQANSRDVVTS